MSIRRVLEDGTIVTSHARGVRGRATTMYSKFHKGGFHAGLVVCSGHADKPRFIIVSLTLMTPRPSPPPGSLVSTPVSRCGWPALVLGAWRAPVLLGWPRDKAYAWRRDALRVVSSYRIGTYVTDAAILRSCQSRSLPALHMCVFMVSTRFNSQKTSKAGCGAHYDID